ncbi:hypothetical protein [uncultured Cohaesibacter sp.]|uniref:hypothetical protein n=1 Tax=uncultured Cohaesibacter sp. TaxID=1002546 RepID=UPI00292EABA1|nr:hypothetical protein [uncultured Cohaesibacter sp.]
MSFSRLIARIFMVPIGFVLAIIAAGIFLSFAIDYIEPAPGVDPTIHGFFMLYSSILITGIVGSLAFFPAIIGLIVAEIFSWRSIWFYLFFGLALSLFATHPEGETMDTLAFALDTRVMASGLIAGFVYWLVAGRGAGIVKRTLDNRPKPL